MQQYNPRVHHQILILFWMWSLALEQVGDNTNTMLNGIQCCSSAWEQIVNGDDVYIFDNIVRIPFTIGGAPALISNLGRARLPGHKLNMLTNTGGQNLVRVSGGVSVQLSLIGTHNATSSLCSPPPPLPATNGAVPTLSMYWHLCLLPSGCESAAIGKRRTNEEGGIPQLQ